MLPKLIKNTTAFIGDTFEQFDNIDILFSDGAITKIQPNINEEGAFVIDGSDFFLTPGFINSHFHPSQQINRALGVGLSHDEQMDLLHITSKNKQKSDSYWLSCLAVLEGLKSGTTCFNSVGSKIQNQYKVYKKMGARAACAMIPKDIVSSNKNPNKRAVTWETYERLKQAEQYHKEYHGDLIRIHFGVVNVRYASDQLILGMLDLANRYDVFFHMHAAESIEYVNNVIHRTGNRPVEHLHKIGALTDRVAMAHATQITPQEIEFISENRAHIIHCPRANSYLAVGVCPVKDLLDHNINVALGSDAAINNNSNEVRGEARFVHDKLAGKYGKANIVDHITLIKMLTINGAKAMGLEKEIGTIAVGKKADIVLWSKNDIQFIPGYNYLADLVFNDSCRAHTVIVNGKTIIENYASLCVDETELIQMGRRISKRYYDMFHSKVVQHLFN